MKTKSRLNFPWTDHDLKRLRAIASKGESARTCATKLRRSPGAVKFKAMVEGVHFHAINQPRGAQRKALRTRRANQRRMTRQARAVRSA